MNPKPKKFAFSWSRLKNYRVCPKKHWHVDLQKEFPEPDNEVLIWGNQVHDAMAARIAKGTPLPRMMEHYEPWPANIAALKKSGMKVLVENQLAMSQLFKPTSYYDNATWFRGRLDVLVINDRQKVAYTFDWKTGQVKPDYEQLALSAQLVFAHYPEMRMVGTSYVWLGNDDHTDKKYETGSLVPVWNELWPEIRAMEEAWRTTTYPPKPSSICLRHCPVTSCPHFGKGNLR